jgi:hypothetical protein
MILTTRRSIFISNAFKAARIASLIFCATLAATASARAQREQLPPPPLPEDPTPLVDLINAQERSHLSDADSPKERIEACLKISDAHLELAYATVKDGNHRQSERELDIYNKALAEAGKIAFSQPKGRRGLAKKIEQKLYKQIKTLEMVVRMFPVERLAFAEDAFKRAKQLRVQAINEAFAAGEVLNDPTREKKPEGSPPEKDGSSLYQSSRYQGAAAARAIVAVGFRRERQIPGDYLNEEEDEFVRRAQDPDLRVRVFMKIADRRLAAMTPAAAPAPDDKKAQERAEKELRTWGPPPKASRAELLRHYARAVAEAIAKLEDAYERNPKSSAIPKALTFMRDSTDKHLEILRSLRSEMKNEEEAAAFRQALDQAETANNGAREGLKAKSQQ